MWIYIGSPWVPLHLLLFTEAREACADAQGHPGADSVEEPLEGKEAGHRDGEDELAEWVHGHPTPLWKDKEEKGFNVKDSKRVLIKVKVK